MTDFKGCAEIFATARKEETAGKRALEVSKELGDIVYVDYWNGSTIHDSCYVIWYPVEDFQVPRMNGALFRIDRAQLKTIYSRVYNAK